MSDGLFRRGMWIQMPKTVWKLGLKCNYLLREKSKFNEHFIKDACLSAHATQSVPMDALGAQMQPS